MHDSLVAEYIDNSDDRIKLDVRFYDTRLESRRLRLSSEQEILDFITGSYYTTVRISQRGREFPSAIINRNFADNSMRIRYYDLTDPQKPPKCSQISYPAWDALSLATAGNHLIKNLASR